MSLSISVDFQLEIKKLFGINSVNVDIWNRLCTSMVKEGPLFASELAIYLVYPHTRLIEFDGMGNLSFHTANKKLKLKPFTPYFEDINIFKDPLPTNQYFDLFEVLEKLQLLDLSLNSNRELIKKWRASMEGIHLYLGKLESTMYADKALSQEVRMIFGLLENRHERKYSGGTLSTGVVLKFSINPQPDNIETLKQLAAMLHIHYEMKRSWMDSIQSEAIRRPKV